MEKANIFITILHASHKFPLECEWNARLKIPLWGALTMSCLHAENTFLHIISPLEFVSLITIVDRVTVEAKKKVRKVRKVFLFKTKIPFCHIFIAHKPPRKITLKSSSCTSNVYFKVVQKTVKLAEEFALQLFQFVFYRSYILALFFFQPSSSDIT